jgi:hypothetical protein
MVWGICKKQGTKIGVINNEALSPQEEMTKDLLSIVHCFSSRLYGLRKYKKELKKIVQDTGKKVTGWFISVVIIGGPMSSLKALKKTLKEDEEIISFTRKEYSKALSKKKLSDLTQVTQGFVKAQNYFLRRFAGINGLAYLSYPHGLRDEYVKNGLPKDLARLGLQDRQWKMALDVAFDTIKSSHAKTQDQVRTSVNRSPTFNDSEKHFIRYILKHPSLFITSVANNSMKLKDSSTLSLGLKSSIRPWKRAY